MVDLEALEDLEEAAAVHAMIERHVRLTGSAFGAAVLADWERSRARFVRVVPREYKRLVLASGDAARRRRRDAATVLAEAAHG
jgi:glutamate synthase domain-containing protein 3